MSNDAAFELTLVENNSKKEVDIKKLSKEEVDRLQKEPYFYKRGILFKLKENDIDDLSIIERDLRKINNPLIEETEIKEPFIYSNVSFFIYCLENKKIPIQPTYERFKSFSNTYFELFFEFYNNYLKEPADVEKLNYYLNIIFEYNFKNLDFSKTKNNNDTDEECIKEEKILKFYLTFLKLFIKRENTKEKIKDIREHLNKLLKKGKEFPIIIRDFKDTLKDIYIMCFEKKIINNYFDYLLDKHQKLIADDIKARLQDNPSILLDDIKALIFFTEKNKKYEMDNLVLFIPINQIIDTFYKVKSEFDEKLKEKYCEIFNNLVEKKISNLIFIYDTDTQKEKIEQRYGTIKEFNKLSDEEKKQKNNEIYISIENTSFLYPYYQLSLSSIPLEIFEIIKFKKTEPKGKRYNEIELIFETGTSIDIEKLIKQKITNEDLKDFNEFFQQYLLLYKKEILTTLFVTPQNNQLIINTEKIENYLRQIIQYLINKGFIEYYKTKTDNKEEFINKIKEDISFIQNEMRKEDNEREKIPLMKYITNLMQTNYDNFENIKEKKEILQLVVEIMKEEFKDFLDFIIQKESVTKEMEILISLAITYSKENENFASIRKNKRNELCFLYWYIMKNKQLFELLEQLMIYIKPKEMKQLYDEEKKIFKLDERNITEDDINILSFSIKDIELKYFFIIVFETLIKQYTLDNIIDNPAIFAQVVKVIEIVKNSLNLISIEEIKLEGYYSLISNLSKFKFNKETTRKLLEKIQNNYNVKCTSEQLKNEFIEWEQEKELFSDFPKFIIQYLLVKYKIHRNFEVRKAMIDIILSNNDYIKKSRTFFEIFIPQVVFDFENEIDIETLDKSIEGTLLEYISNKLKEKPNELLENIIINLVENSILSDIRNSSSNTPKIISPLYINYFKTSVSYLDNPTNEIIKLHCIAFIKVELYYFFREINEKKIDFYDLTSELSKNQSKLGNVLKIYLLKNVRNSVNNFEAFKNYSYMNKQMIWATEYKFSEKYKSNFEYIFISECKEGNENFEKKYKENINLFNEIQQQIFSTNQEKDYIVDELCSYDCDIFLDVMFNVIFSKLYSVKYRKESLEFNEFTAWFKNLYDTGISKKENQKLIKYYEKTICQIDKIMDLIQEEDLHKIEIILICLKFTLLLSFLKNDSTCDFTIKSKEWFVNLYEIYYHLQNTDIIDDKYVFRLSKESEKWKYIQKEQQNLNNVIVDTLEKGNMNDIEIEAIQKQSKALLAKNSNTFKNITNFFLTNYQGYGNNDEESMKNLLAMNLLMLMYYSYDYFINEVKIEGIEFPTIFFDIYKTISKLLHLLNIPNDKLFVNVFYVEMKSFCINYNEEKININKVTTKIFEIIELYRTNEKQFISYLNDKVEYDEKEMRNLTLDRRIQIENINDNEYPYFKYFYYSKYPTLYDFKEQFNKIYHKENKFPITNEIVNCNLDIFNQIDQKKMNELLTKILPNLNDLSKVDLENIDNKRKKTTFINVEKTYYYNGYFLSFESIIIFYSHRNNMNKDSIIYSNGDIIEYDYMGIEKEVSLILINASYQK